MRRCNCPDLLPIYFDTNHFKTQGSQADHIDVEPNSNLVCVDLGLGSSCGGGAGLA